MKSIRLPMITTFLLLGALEASAAMYTPLEPATIGAMDTESLGVLIDASEQALPSPLLSKMIAANPKYKMTVLEQGQVDEIFEEMKNDPNARQPVAGGNCAVRRAYVQKKLKARGVVTGQLFIHCNRNKGVMTLQDRVSGRNMTFINYHDAGVAMVQTSAGVELQVLDIQFSDGPLPLRTYLGEVEANQKLEPDTDKFMGSLSLKKCYWSVNTPGFSSKSIK